MDSTKQTLTILCGNVGSGKTSFYEKELSNDIRVSQDVLGSKEECIKVVRTHLSNKESVVIDRVNFNRAQRALWIKLAKEFEVEIHCVYLYVPIDICLERICARTNHETIKEDMPVEKKLQIVENFDKMWEDPSMEEGYKSIVIIRNYE